MIFSWRTEPSVNQRFSPSGTIELAFGLDAWNGPYKMSKPASEKILIYIPCWTDYLQALDQVAKLRTQMETLRNSLSNYELEVDIALSINGVNVSKEEIEKIKNLQITFNYFQETIGGDLNICLGFIESLKSDHKYLWILSANDSLGNSALFNVKSNLDSEQDLLVFNRTENTRSLKVSSVFDPQLSAEPFGLISSVIYNVERLKKYFPSSLQMAWTGWGHLSVIESACINQSSISVKSIPESLIFIQETSHDLEKTRETVKRNYHHSFFGMPILINFLFSSDSVKRRFYMNNWLKANWYKISFFSRNSPKRKTRAKFGTNIWIEVKAREAVSEIGLKGRLLYFLGQFINWEYLSRFKFPNRLRKL
jgi:hypothetical protein